MGYNSSVSQKKMIGIIVSVIILLVGCSLSIKNTFSLSNLEKTEAVVTRTYTEGRKSKTDYIEFEYQFEGKTYKATKPEFYCIYKNTGDKLTIYVDSIEIYTSNYSPVTIFELWFMPGLLVILGAIGLASTFAWGRYMAKHL